LKKGEIIFWVTLILGALMGFFVFRYTKPQLNGAVWAVLSPLVFIIVAYAIVLFILNLLRQLTKD
jgi:hypothetical protein